MWKGDAHGSPCTKETPAPKRNSLASALVPACGAGSGATARSALDRRATDCKFIVYSEYIASIFRSNAPPAAGMNPRGTHAQQECRRPQAGACAKKRPGQMTSPEDQPRGPAQRTGPEDRPRGPAQRTGPEGQARGPGKRPGKTAKAKRPGKTARQNSHTTSPSATPSVYAKGPGPRAMAAIARRGPSHCGSPH